MTETLDTELKTVYGGTDNSNDTDSNPNSVISPNITQMTPLSSDQLNSNIATIETSASVEASINDSTNTNSISNNSNSKRSFRDVSFAIFLYSFDFIFILTELLCSLYS